MIIFNNMSKTILGWGIVNALATLAYIGFVVGIMSNSERIFDTAGRVVGPMAMLNLFVMSAAINGALVLGRPIWWYLAGQKKESVKLFITTVAWLAILFAVIVLAAMVRF